MPSTKIRGLAKLDNALLPLLTPFRHVSAADLFDISQEDKHQLDRVSIGVQNGRVETRAELDDSVDGTNSSFSLDTIAKTPGILF